MELPSCRLVLSLDANFFGTVQKMNLTACESLASPTVTIICMCFPECFEPKSLQPKKKKKKVFLLWQEGLPCYLFLEEWDLSPG